MVSVYPRTSSVWEQESQKEFESQIIAARTGKWMMTYPYNTGTGYPWEWRNVPASRLAAHMTHNVWPSKDRGSGIGDVRLQPERLDLTGVFHFDDTKYASGHYISDGALAYSTKHKSVAMVDSEGMLEPTAVSFWWRPIEGSLGSNAL